MASRPESEQQRRERIAHEERKRVIAKAERVDPVASVQASVPHKLHGVATAPET
jgi:hypothetical protein